MRVWSTLYNFFAVLLIAFMLIVLYKDILENERQLEKLRLNLAIKYATEAAFASSLEGGNLGISYDDLQNVKVAPSNTLEVFKSLILLSYDMSLSQTNYDSLDNYISSGVLAVADGYYLTTPKSYEDNTLIWGLKRPYKIEYPNKTAVAYNLSNENWVLVRQNANNTVTIDRGVKWRSIDGTETDLATYGVPTPTTKEITSKLNKLIMDDVNYYIRERNKIKTKVGANTVESYTNKAVNDFVYLPSIQTESGVNTITKPSILFTMSGVDFAGVHKIEAQSVGGFTIAKKRRVIVFTEGGVKYYCYEGQIDDVSKVTNFYDSPEEAARAGFSPHLIFLSKELK